MVPSNPAHLTAAAGGSPWLNCFPFGSLFRCLVSSGIQSASSSVCEVGGVVQIAFIHSSRRLRNGLDQPSNPSYIRFPGISTGHFSGRFHL